MTGNEMLARIKDHVDEYTNSGAEQTRALRSLNASRKLIQAEIWALAEDYLRTTGTFTTTQTAPNAYTISTVNSNAFADFGRIRGLERVVDDATADYERIFPLPDWAAKYDIAANYDRISGMLTSSTSQGEPKFYDLAADTLYLFPIPDSTSYTIRMTYLKRLSAIVADGTDLPDIPEALGEVMAMDAAIEERTRRNMGYADIERLREKMLAVALASLHGRIDDGPKVMNYVDSHYV